VSRSALAPNLGGESPKPEDSGVRIGYLAPMIEDLPAIREQLSDHWQKIGVDLLKRGFQADAVFETMLTVGLAGLVELHGRDATAKRLNAIAHRLSELVRKESEAMSEAKGATKN
jgi:hypothetical protein